MKKLKSFCIVSGLKIGAIALFFSFLSGCACEEHVGEPNWVTRALRRNPLSTFVDSSNNYLQILVFDTTYTTSPSYEDNYRDDCLDYSPRTIGMFYPDIPGKRMHFFQHNGDLKVNDVSPYYLISAGDTTLTFQGVEFTQCYYYQQMDSLGVSQELVLSAEYGILLFSYRDHYRWERVLNP